MPETKQPYTAEERSRLVERVMDASDRLMQRMSADHATEFVEIGVTMSQAKALHLIAVDREVRMSVLAQRLGVTLSTVSGLIERLVEARLVDRRDDRLDRRQVLLSLTPEGERILERFHDLNRRQLQALLDPLTDPDLTLVARAIELLAGSADRPEHEDPRAGAIEGSAS